jgi:hypothetical protein
MGKEKVAIDTENSFDFGFSFTDEAELAAPQRTSVVEEYKAKLQELEKLILPLLNNLKKNPDKPYIKWENRVPVIDAQIEKILLITRS